MEPKQPNSRPKDCPDCGAQFPNNATNCWLCGWRQGEPVGVRPKHAGPANANPYAPPALNPADLKWTFSLSTLFLWTALVAVVMGVVRIAPGLGIALGVLAVPAALHTTAVAAYRTRRSGRVLTVQEKIVAFIESFALFTSIAIALGVAAVGALFVICMSSNTGMLRNVNFTFPIIATVAGLIFISFVVFLLVRALWKIKD